VSSGGARARPRAASGGPAGRQQIIAENGVYRRDRGVAFHRTVRSLKEGKKAIDKSDACQAAADAAVGAGAARPLHAQACGVEPVAHKVHPEEV
jgi:hypothetical protein